MRDGIDHKAFAAELRTLSPLEQKARSDQLTAWLRTAARAKRVGLYSKSSIILLIVAALLAYGGYVSGSRILLANAAAMLAPAVLSGLESNRLAREWRRNHPFGGQSIQQRVSQLVVSENV